MELILWRHADAEEGYPDAERKLTDKGRAQAKRMAAWLNEHLPADAIILVSPAARAQQTAKALNRKFMTLPAVGTGSDAALLLEAARWPKAERTTLVVGHQPTLGQAASLLLTGAEGDLSVKKGAVWWLEGRDARHHAVLVAAMTPEML